MDWLVVRSQIEPGAAHFTHIQNYEDSFRLKHGVPLRDSFPAESEVRMDPDFPNDIELVDSLYSSRAYLVVNQKVRQLFERAGVTNVEFLSIRVVNHKKRPVKEAHFVVNPLSLVDCIDVAKSTRIEWNSITPTMIDGLKKMVLDPARLPTDIKLFRPTNMNYVMLIHRCLADQIGAEKLRGFRFTEIDAFKE
jgi:hypothetical protein